MPTRAPILDILNLRTKLGMTQAEFADAVGVAKMTVWRWEQGTTPQRLARRQILYLRETREAEDRRRAVEDRDAAQHTLDSTPLPDPLDPSSDDQG